MRTRSQIRRKPILESREDRLASAILRFNKQGPDLLASLEEELMRLRLQVEARGLNQSEGRAESLVNALR